MNPNLTFEELQRITKELRKMTIPLGTLVIENENRFNVLPRWINNQPNANCPRCGLHMTRQPRGGLKCGRADCSTKPGMTITLVP